MQNMNNQSQKPQTAGNNNQRRRIQQEMMSVKSGLVNQSKDMTGYITQVNSQIQ
jgi:hypothetical protein